MTRICGIICNMIHYEEMYKKVLNPAMISSDIWMSKSNIIKISDILNKPKIRTRSIIAVGNYVAHSHHFCDGLEMVGFSIEAERTVNVCGAYSQPLSSKFP
jgi:hypothetical protein